MERRVVEGFPFTAEWYEGREHAPHLEQPAHTVRLQETADTVARLVAAANGENPAIKSIVDFGCGDGGLLSLLARLDIPSWGYDLQRNNVRYGIETRGVDTRYRDFTSEEDLDWGDLAVITECLEHLDDPHGLVRRLGEHCKYLVASSPAFETPTSHDACHAWVWDVDGYRELIRQGGFRVLTHRVVGAYGFQILAAARG